MDFIELDIPDVVLIEPRVFGDAWVFFLRLGRLESSKKKACP